MLSSSEVGMDVKESKGDDGTTPKWKLEDERSIGTTNVR